MRLGIIIQSRNTSTRLPGKAFADISGKPLTEHIIDRLKTSISPNDIILAVPDNPEEEPLVVLAKYNGIQFFRGSERDVLDRYYQAAIKFELENIIRITGDNPLIFSEGIQDVLKTHITNKNDYTSITQLPLGCGFEIFTFEALTRVWKDGKEKHHREHVTTYINENPDYFKIERILPEENFRHPEYRLTVDTEDDLKLIREIYRHLYKGKPLLLKEVIELLNNRDDLVKINSDIKQKPPTSFQE